VGVAGLEPATYGL